MRPSASQRRMSSRNCGMRCAYMRARKPRSVRPFATALKRFGGPGTGAVALYVEIAPHSVTRPRGRSASSAADVVEVQVDAVRRGGPQQLADVAVAVAERGVGAEPVAHERDLLGGAGA